MKCTTRIAVAVEKSGDSSEQAEKRPSPGTISGSQNLFIGPSVLTGIARQSTIKKALPQNWWYITSWATTLLNPISQR